MVIRRVNEFVAAICLSLLLISSHTSSAADPNAPAYTSAEKAAAEDPDYRIQGEYVGENLGVQFVALGQGQFQTVIYRGGLPGAGWNEKERQAADEDSDEVKATIANLKLKKVDRKSPTLGRVPPTGAHILFDGTQASIDKNWAPGAQLSSDHLLKQGCTTREGFQSFSLHIEFQLPYMPQSRGQGRGNSGLYIHGRYELQMLDSFGLEGKDNECGGLYQLKNPDVNMCLPPLSWQTYDVDFTAPRFDADGKKIENARLTVRHNGVAVHQNVELPKPTPGSMFPDDQRPGQLHLQNHGDEVRYRNIWIIARDPQQEARRPMVPGFERFYATGGDPVHGGRLLLAELNCTSCHSVENSLSEHLIRRQAPILDDVGKRVRPEFLVKFLEHPHDIKPGTLMPDLLSGLSEADRHTATLALAHFLATTGVVPEKGSDRQSMERGRQLFQRVGCLACHGPVESGQQSPLHSVPLAKLADKYSIASLAEFLKDPHKSRPSGRMPQFPFQDPNRETVDLACYLIGDVGLNNRPRKVNLKYSAFEGEWEKLPNFDVLTPYKSGETAGLNLNEAGRASTFGMRFDGYLNVVRDGNYKFHLGSDDGSQLLIDGVKVIDNDGVHPHSHNSANVALKKGAHAVRVDYFQGGGEWTLDLDYEGPGVPRQDLSYVLTLTESGNPVSASDQTESDAFVLNRELADQGRVLFGSLGCSNCHQLKYDGAVIPPLAGLKPLKGLDLSRGCLAVEASNASNSSSLAAAPNQPRTPNYDLNENQRASLAAIIQAPAPAAAPSNAELINHTMTAFNCYACHKRQRIGGPERDRNTLFTSAIPEMGDEGRIPPALDGVGDKLNDNWLKHVLQNGSIDRPYMQTRMPRFGGDNVGHLASAFIAEDRRTEADVPEHTDHDSRVISSGRFLVGDKALSCIKCHTFGPHQATGIQALNLQTMSQRLREDWFYRYLKSPETYRPGTRMPTPFVGGRSAARDVYEGDPGKQSRAIWMYLKQGEKAGIPDGLIANVIELKPEKTPIIYRNFIDGLTARGIAVGYPEKANLAWDANTFALKQMWHGRFIDAGKHWEGRGPGFQTALGDHLLPFEESAPFAQIESNGPWPSQSPRLRGFKFKGYSLDNEGRPHFRYSTNEFSVEDFPKPLVNGEEAGFSRTLQVKANGPVKNLYFRAARSSRLDLQPDGRYLINGVIHLRLKTPNAAQVQLRESNGARELLLPITLTNGQATIEEEIEW